MVFLTICLICVLVFLGVALVLYFTWPVSLQQTRLHGGASLQICADVRGEAVVVAAQSLVEGAVAFADVVHLLLLEATHYPHSSLPLGAALAEVLVLLVALLLVVHDAIDDILRQSRLLRVVHVVLAGDLCLCRALRRRGQIL